MLRNNENDYESILPKGYHAMNISSQIDYKKIITIPEASLLTEDDYKSIEKACRDTRKKYLVKGTINPLEKEEMVRNISISNIDKNKMKCAREVAKARALLYDPEMVISILLSQNVSYEDLKLMMLYVQEIKRVKAMELPFTDDYYTEEIENLCEKVANVYGYYNKGLVLNRLVDIAVTEEDLYQSVTNEVQKKMNF